MIPQFTILKDCLQRLFRSISISSPLLRPDDSTRESSSKECLGIVEMAVVWSVGRLS